MMERSRYRMPAGACLAGLLVTCLLTTSYGQNPHGVTSRDTLITIAREIMEAAHFCTFVTLDQAGQPHSRIMDPFLPDEDMVVWMGTTRQSRKVGEIENDPRVNLLFADPESGSYVSISGTAELVDDLEKKSRYWKEAWTPFYPDRENDYLLIAVTPQRMEVISYSRGVVGDPHSWSSPVVDF